jgi:nucleoside-diphosphate-sugar epimerase
LNFSINMNKENFIYVSGSSGFVGKNVINFFANKKFIVQKILRSELYSTNLITFKKSSIIIHLAGKAHDLKNISDPQDYYQINTELTKNIFDRFIDSDAKVFITLSSVKAIADVVVGELSEEQLPNPQSHYGKSKLFAEDYILSKQIPEGKRVYILRPCMIHGPGNKGNLNLLYKFVSKGIPWPLGSFDNKRSFCSIDNLVFIIKELIENPNIASGIYNIADDEPIGTNKIIEIIYNNLNRKPRIMNIPICIVNNIAKAGDIFNLPLNTEKLSKLTETYIVSNNKIKKAINKPLPVSTINGLSKTFNSFIN